MPLPPRLKVNGPIPARELVALFQHAPWASRRTPAQVRRMLANTEWHVTARTNGRLVGFGRVITDGVFRALLDDVIVEPASRGFGLGRRMVAHLVRRVRHVEEIMLTTGHVGLLRFYAPAGFTRARGHTFKCHPLRSRP